MDLKREFSSSSKKYFGCRQFVGEKVVRVRLEKNSDLCFLLSLRNTGKRNAYVRLINGL